MQFFFIPFSTRLFLSRILSPFPAWGWVLFPRTLGHGRWATVSSLICLSVEAMAEAAAAAATEYGICIFILLFFVKNSIFMLMRSIKTLNGSGGGGRKLRSARSYQLLAMRESEMIVQLNHQQQQQQHGEVLVVNFREAASETTTALHRGCGGK